MSYCKNLRLIVAENIEELGGKVNYHLNKLHCTNQNYIIPVTNCRFSNGEAKGVISKEYIQNDIRDKDIFILSDTGNYGQTYKMYGRTHEMSPDDHFQDLKRIISATGKMGKRISVVMPLLYESRQHKKVVGESLDSVMALQELERMGVENVITIDAHDPKVGNYAHLAFENFYPTIGILNDFIDKEKNHMKNIIVVSPDEGAMTRARYFAEVLGTDVGFFYKKRDLSRVIDGKNQIISHEYTGPSVEKKSVLITDDMIASGGSILKSAIELKERGASSIYFLTTFSLFTEGYEKFQEMYEKGLFNKIYSTNLTYVPENIKQKEWFHQTDCSEYLASIISAIHKNDSLDSLRNGKEKILAKMQNL